MENLLENQLILRCKQGDSSAFSLLINNYRRQLFTYLIRLSGNRETAEDLFQDTLLKVWKALPNYAEQNKFSSWLFSIAHNIAMDAHRKNKVRSGVRSVENTDQFVSAGNFLSTIEHEELKELIVGSLKLLPENQRNVFLLRQHGELTFKEIAEMTNQPLNTVLSHMQYAVKKLRKILREKNVVR